MEIQGLPGRLLAELGPAIASGELPEGTVLRAEELEERFGVSRTVVREAVRILEGMRLVASRRRVGITVQPRSGWDVFDPLVIRWRLAGADRSAQLRSLGSLRLAVEPAAAALAARHATDDERRRLSALAVELTMTARAADLATFLRHDIEFHSTVLQASRNEMFAHLGDTVGAVLTGRTEYHLMPHQPEPYAIRLHREVAEAVCAGDAERAEQAMRTIVEGALTELNHQLG
ncbi:FadR/GntR family transcriptional regulator [Kitasatospora purpeofusca]|uniref:FadR/GntR family transcriptional regulator n=1 Tax=Kitasatospora purpeofusca TaxID=67352 RepID=UPI0022508B17|nr:FCD domain-containing protein [Kitasatospora purpeofusca]MCX4756430.1 FCD domain-containing protein [Kitasatospora purpeofusca]WSR35751.1 FCD domain-containing protein [Kitasatospora purpeofusca]WSR44058.1 FCD domain-containing protein [Kitasatospora purpeofusca]